MRPTHHLLLTIALQRAQPPNRLEGNDLAWRNRLDRAGFGARWMPAAPREQLAAKGDLSTETAVSTQSPSRETDKRTETQHLSLASLGATIAMLG